MEGISNILHRMMCVCGGKTLRNRYWTEYVQLELSNKKAKYVWMYVERFITNLTGTIERKGTICLDACRVFYYKSSIDF